MTVKEIIEIESANTGSINLFKEGIFWRSYNQSAMRMYEHFYPYKVIVKYVKKVQQKIYYCGFPENSLNNIREKAIEKGFQITEIKDKKNNYIRSFSNRGLQKLDENSTCLFK